MSRFFGAGHVFEEDGAVAVDVTATTVESESVGELSASAEVGDEESVESVGPEDESEATAVDEGLSVTTVPELS